MSDITMRQGAEFPKGESTLTKAGSEALNTIATAIREHSSKPEVTIIAYANDAPSVKANARLSRARAEAIADYLRHQNIGDASLKHEGRGRPVILPADKVAQQNPYYRRVELLITEQPAQPALQE